MANFVRSLREAASAVRDMKKDVEELSRAIDELSGKDVRIRVIVEGQEQIRELRDDLDRLAHERFEVTVGVNADQAGITRLREDLDRLNATGDTRIRVTVEVHGMEELRMLRLEIDRLTMTRHTVRINVDAGRGIAQVMALNTAMGTLGNTTANTGRDAERASGEFGGGGGGGMMGAIIALIPAIAALGEVTAGVGAGLAGSFATMGVGVGAFALFAIPTIKQVSKVLTDMTKGTKQSAAEWKALSPEMKIAVTNLKDFKDRFAELQKQLQPTVLKVFAEGLNVARAGIEQLAKVAKPAGEAIAPLLHSLAQNMMSGGLAKFFQYVAQNIGFFIKTWGTAVMNFIEGIANMIRAFDPLSKFVSNGFLGMSQSFLKWSQSMGQSKGFQQFVQFTITNGPKVLDMIGNLVKTLVTLVVQLAPAGMGMIGMISTILKLAAAFMQAHPQVAKLVGQLLPLVALAIQLAPVISAVAGAIAGLTAPIALAIAAIVAIAAVIMVWWNKCASFRDFVTQLWGTIKKDFAEGIKDAKDQVSAILPLIVELWNKYGKNIMEYVKGMWDVISGIIKGAIKIIGGIIRVFLGLLTGNWSAVWKGLCSILSGVWDIIKGVVVGGLHMLNGLFGGFINAMWNVGKSIVNGLWQGIQSAWGWLVSQFKGALHDLRSMLPFSPAKKGPFSGSGWTTYSGKAIVEGLAEGIKARQSLARNTMLDMVAMLQGAVPNQLNMGIHAQAKMSGAMAYAGASNQQLAQFAPGAIQINNPAQEPASDSLNRTMTRISRFGLFSGATA